MSKYFTLPNRSTITHFTHRTVLRPRLGHKAAGKRMINSFGIKEEMLIIKSNARNVFTPHHPVNDIDLLRGRNEEVQKILSHMNTPGQHVILYGDRGVGKSSLAHVIRLIMIIMYETAGDFRCYIKRCGSCDTFLSIFEDIICDLSNERPGLLSHQQRHVEGGSAGLKLGFANAGLKSDRETLMTTEPLQRRITPSKLASELSGRKGLILIDEFDSISNDDDKRKVAELIKILSDSLSSFKIFIVGISESAESLIGHHPSVHRCLKEVKLRRLNDIELRKIVVEGLKKLDMRFEDDVIDIIVELSAGYPHFTHLLSLKCAEIAIVESLPSVTRSTLIKAKISAKEDAEATLKRIYNASVRSTTDMYKKIICVCSYLKTHEFSTYEIRHGVEDAFGSPLKPGSLANYMKKLASDDGSKILIRVKKGMYRFSDPRMSSYVRIATEGLQLQY